MNNTTSQLEALSSDSRRAVYERLWYELTIAGRAVWSDPNLANEQKLEGLKWLNEIQHRIWGAHKNPGGYSPSDLIGLIGAHVEKSPYIQPLVSGAISAAIKFVVPFAFNPS